MEKIEKKLIKFYHENTIKSINEQLPLKLKEMLEDENRHGDSVTINELSTPCITGPKNNEMIISKYEIVYNEKKLKLIYIESVVSAEMTIMVGKEIIGSIKKMKRINDKIIEKLFRTVREGITGRK